MTACSKDPVEKITQIESLEELHSLWDSVRTKLRNLVSDTAFHIWISPLQIASISSDAVIITAPGSILSWVEQRFGFIISRELSGQLGRDVSVRIVEESRFDRVTNAAGLTTFDARHRMDVEQSACLIPKYTFDQFVIGESNRFAHASALAVAESPAQAYNPLFLYSANGLGKTHLLQSIAGFLISHSPKLNVIYTTVESFTNLFVSSIKSGDTFSFKDRFRKTDVLLIDDIQFLEGKKNTQEEFFHTFNALYELGSQLVLSSDRPPSDLHPLHSRLKSRFDLGLTVEILPPDFSTRLSILKKRASFDKISDIDDLILEFVAGNVTGNIRSLEGALIRIVAYSSLKQKRPSVELAKEALSSFNAQPRSGTAIISTIKEVVSSKFNVSVDDLSSTRRTHEVSLPRHVAMYVCRQITDLSLPQIAAEFKRKDHTTVLNATNKVNGMVTSNPSFAESIDSLIFEIERRCPQATPTYH